MSDPLKCQFERNGLRSIKIAELLFRNQIVALVGGADNNQWPNTKVIIWDDYQLRKIDEIKVGQAVLAVKLRKDKLVVVMRKRVHIYNLADLEFFGALETADNPLGVVALNSTTETFVLAVLHEENPNDVFIQMLNHSREHRVIHCHSNPIGQLALNHDGRYLATASIEGKRIKVFNSYTMQELRVFRHGIKTTQIGQLCFSKNANYLGSISPSQKIHVWKLGFGDTETRVMTTRKS